MQRLILRLFFIWSRLTHQSGILAVEIDSAAIAVLAGFNGKHSNGAGHLNKTRMQYTRMDGPIERVSTLKFEFEYAQQIGRKHGLKNLYYQFNYNVRAAWKITP